MDLSFQNNQTFFLSLDISAWKPDFPLTVCTFHMQVRTGPTIVPIIYAWSSDPTDMWGNGAITYIDNPGLLQLSAPYNDMIELIPGAYEWDLALIFDANVKVLTGGAFVITGGITLQ